jgi:PAS domain S-box-containing protein
MDNTLKILYIRNIAKDKCKISKILPKETILHTVSSFSNAKAVLISEQINLIILNTDIKSSTKFLNETKSLSDYPFLLLLNTFNEILDHQSLKLKFKNYLIKSDLSSEILKKSISHLLRKTNPSHTYNKEKNLYRSILKGAKDPIVFTDKNGFIIKSNEAAKLLFNFPLNEDPFGLSIYSFVPDVEFKKAIKNYRLVLSGQKKSNSIYILQSLDHKIFHAQIHPNVVLNKDGKPDGVVSIIRNITQLLKDQKALEESKNIYKTLFENAGDSIFIMEYTSIIDCNQMTLSVFGMDNKSDIIGHHPWEFSPKYQENGESTVALGRKHLTQTKKNKSKKFFWIHKRKNGDLFNAEVSLSYIRHEGKDRIIAIVRDISDQIKLDKIVKKNEEYLKKVLNSSPEAIFSTDLRMNILNCNDSTVKIFGAKNQSELIGKNISDFVIKEDKLLVRKAVRKFFKINKIRKFNFRLRKLNNEIFTGSLSAQLLKNDEGNPASIIANISDITSRINTEKALIASEEKNRALSQSTREAVLFSKNGYCIEANEATSQMFGYTHDELIGIFGTDLVVSEHKKLVKHNMLSGYEEPYEALAITKSGIKFWVEFHGSMYEYMGEKVRVTTIKNIDIQKRTMIELKKAKEKAEESDRLKSTFLGTMSHELRTPLNAIIGFSDLFDTNLSKNDMILFSKTINESGKNLLSIIEDILNISLIETGKIKTNPEKVNIPVFLHEVNELTKYKLKKEKKTNITLNYFSVEQLKNNWGFFDPYKTKQVLDHIIKNAIKFTNKGFIELQCDYNNNEIIFSIKDTGIGIEQKNYDLIFDWFRQADDSHTRAYGGTGLGLSIAKKLLDLLGGRIWLESEPGKGTIFYIKIPIKKNNSSSENKKDDSNKKSFTNLNVLVVEDEESNFLYLKTILESIKTKVIHAWNGKEAIDIINKDVPVDIILMDLKMPEVNGFEATREIKKTNPNLIIIAQTAYAMGGDKEKALNAGCDDYISKPIKKELLIKLLEQYL